MALYIILALLNGVVVGTTRAINGQLSTVLGPFKASFWNHIVGFVFLTLMLFVLGGWKSGASGAPLYAYLGGFFGAFYVAMYSYVLPRLGGMKVALLVISGQMISAVLMDYHNQDVPPTAARFLGVVMVLFGMQMTRRARSPEMKAIHDD
ncbi:DMT family transporter [Polyangium sp. y55x31]|uniref:DMT family transporter n=1 Tax=Polyangium sp. y55x31 TaxID=3042688 RepID=UPI0024826655|nr:DMT family transporter [Polyangium sp. y55x31]MDI1476293.1 DMT family transporter [Polyangium sp. y55x31]